MIIACPTTLSPREKKRPLGGAGLAAGVTSTLKQNGRSQEWSYASALTCSVLGIAWVRPDSESRSVTQRTCWAHCRSCVRRNTRQWREQDVRHAATKRRFAQARSASFDIFAVDCGAKRLTPNEGGRGDDCCHTPRVDARPGRSIRMAASLREMSWTCSWLQSALSPSNLCLGP